jgi:hypothetical protein
VIYWIHPEAAADLELGALYFVANVSAQVADEFLAEYERIIEIVQSNRPLGLKFMRLRIKVASLSIGHGEYEFLEPLTNKLLV